MDAFITDKELGEVKDFLSRENIEIGGWLAIKAYQMVLEIERLKQKCFICGHLHNPELTEHIE